MKTMKTFPSRLNRRVIKAQLFASVPSCQWPGCAERPTEMHELVTRALTQSNELARNLSFAPELCAALCHEHHVAAHNAQGATETLFRVNIAKYGREAVNRALRAVRDAMRSRLSIELPEGD